MYEMQFIQPCLDINSRDNYTAKMARIHRCQNNSIMAFSKSDFLVLLLRIAIEIWDFPTNFGSIRHRLQGLSSDNEKAITIQFSTKRLTTAEPKRTWWILAH
jgi:hypothetical protein